MDIEDAKQGMSVYVAGQGHAVFTVVRVDERDHQVLVADPSISGAERMEMCENVWPALPEMRRQWYGVHRVLAASPTADDPGLMAVLSTCSSGGGNAFETALVPSTARDDLRAVGRRHALAPTDLNKAMAEMRKRAGWWS